MSSLMHDITKKTMPEWDFIDSGSSPQHTVGENRRVYSIIGPEGSHRGYLHLNRYEMEIIKSLMRTGDQHKVD